MTEEGQNTPQLVDLIAFEIDQLLGLFIGLLSAKAWQYMGLQLAPGKGELEKDLVKASTAIDCVSLMVGKLATSLPESERARLEAMVADLQINYAKQA